MKKIAVIGVGSAGLLSLCHFVYWLRDHNVEIYSIYDPSIPIVGIGESANPFFWDAMSRILHTQMTLDEFLEKKILDSTVKYGTFYKNWASDDVLVPLFGHARQALHFNTFEFKDFVFPILKDLLGFRFSEVHGRVTNIKNDIESISLNVDDREYTFDYVIDCRGFTESYENHVVLDMPLNHALVHNTDEIKDWDNTLHEASKNGWIFGVPLATRTSYGYLFNNNITNIDDAKKDFSEYLGIPIETLEDKEYKFKSYYIKKIIDKRLIKNGNAAFFLEPMFSNSLFMYDHINRFAYDYIVTNKNSDIINYEFQKMAIDMHDLICYFYMGGSKYDTDFWKYASDYSKKIIKDSLIFNELRNKFSFMKENNCTLGTDLPYTSDSLKFIDEKFEYNYFQ